jgi:amino acid adenylation domain-containing protein
MPQRVKVRPGRSFAEWPVEEIERSVPSRFEDIVRRYPARLALKSGAQALTYDELNRSANRLARAVLEQHEEGEKPVALLLEHSASAILAILAVLKAGKFYLPLDPTYPVPRLAGILSDSQTSLIISDRPHLSLAEEIAPAGSQLLNIDALQGSANGDNLSISIPPPESLFNLAYTSGSSGRPKGVLQTHRNIIHNTREATHLLKFDREDRFALIMPITFGASASDIFGALLNGASLFLFDPRKQGLGELIHWLRQEQISVYHSVPTVYRHMLGRLGDTETIPSVRVIELGGEPVLKHDIELFKKHFSDQCVLMNDLGTTETYLASAYLVDKSSEITGPTVPVGFALGGREVLVFDENGRAAEPGEIGEIAIKSRYLSPGYWQQPDLTAAVFLPDHEGGEERIYLMGDLGRLSPEGYLEYLGRKDDLVKIRGQRVETAEVETALLDLEVVREAVVVAQKGSNGDNRLVAYLIPVGEPPNVSDLRRDLMEKFPEHMVPSAFVTMERFPLLPFGKVDRRALPPPDTSRPNLKVPYEPPHTQTQARLADLFAQVLRLDQAGIHDDFFELGADSLLATQLVARIQDEFRVSLPIASLFETPTVAGLAQLVIREQLATLPDDELDQILAELQELTDEEAQRILDGEAW